jgi:hypothetical protein
LTRPPFIATTYSGTHVVGVSVRVDGGVVAEVGAVVDGPNIAFVGRWAGEGPLSPVPTGVVLPEGPVPEFVEERHASSEGGHESNDEDGEEANRLIHGRRSIVESNECWMRERRLSLLER